MREVRRRGFIYADGVGHCVGFFKLRWDCGYIERRPVFPAVNKIERIKCHTHSPFRVPSYVRPTPELPTYYPWVYLDQKKAPCTLVSQVPQKAQRH